MISATEESIIIYILQWIKKGLKSLSTLTKLSFLLVVNNQDSNLGLSAFRTENPTNSQKNEF